MTFIDWSDPEEMLGLLAEFVADERSDARADPTREAFLAEILAELTDLNDNLQAMSPDETIGRLRAIHRRHAEAFPGEPVLCHVEDCVVELERIQGETADRRTK